METNAKYVLVGVSIVLLILMAAGTIVWLRRNSSDADLSFYEVYFHNQSVGGLQEGSSVTMKGIPVGSVRTLAFDRDNTERVRVVLAIRLLTPVKRDSRAVVMRNLVTGLSTIDLTTGSRGAEALLGARRSSPEYPTIPEGRGEFEQLKSSAPALLERSGEALAAVQQLLSPENRTHTEEILRNISQLTEMLASKDRGVESVLVDARALLKVSRETVLGIRQAAEGVQSSLSAFTRQLSDATTRVSGSVYDASRKVSEAAQKLQDPRRVLTGPAQTELGPGEERR